MPKYKMWQLEGKEISIREFVEHAEDYPIDRILLVPHVTPGKGVIAEEISLEDLKRGNYLNDKGTFEIEEHDDGVDPETGPIILKYLFLCISKHDN